MPVRKNYGKMFEAKMGRAYKRSGDEYAHSDTAMGEVTVKRVRGTIYASRQNAKKQNDNEPHLTL